MKSSLQKLLLWLTKKVLNRHKPYIIAITGSVGKTSAKEAVYAVVSQKFSARKPEKNFNTEFGLPYAVLGIKKDPGRSLIEWTKLLVAGLSQAFFNVNFPKVLILEMGVDHPGDMDYFMSFVRPDIGIITAIGESHLEFFQSLEGIEEEKGKIVLAIPQEGWLLLNADNEASLRQKSKTRGKTLTYALNNQADVTLNAVKEEIGDTALSTIEVNTPAGKIQAKAKALGTTHLSALACACAVGTALKIENDLVAKGLRDYRPTPGRMNIIPGIKKSFIIDDSYNASPTSTKAALNLLGRLPGNYKMAVLGDMLELGSIFEQAHLEIGGAAAALKVDKLVTVGSGGKVIAQGARSGGLPADKIISFDNSVEAIKLVEEFIQPNSLVLIKGSQSMRMERIAKEILAEPMRAKELLCRQYGRWIEE